LFPETSECAMDIDPQADRLVFFWSDRRNPHVIMPVHRHRFAITIWYMDKTDRRAAFGRKACRRAAACRYSLLRTGGAAGAAAAVASSLQQGRPDPAVAAREATAATGRHATRTRQ
ncbi:hypothetical protein PENTCL1PPCAC_3793, partial [Pristionchus entomophagus]